MALQGGSQTHYPLMAVSRVEPGKYIDQLAKKIYHVDHLKSEIVSVEDHNPALIESVEELLSHLSAAANKYIQTYYR